MLHVMHEISARYTGEVPYDQYVSGAEELSCLKIADPQLHGMSERWCDIITFTSTTPYYEIRECIKMHRWTIFSSTGRIID